MLATTNDGSSGSGSAGASVGAHGNAHAGHANATGKCILRRRIPPVFPLPVYPLPYTALLPMPDEWRVNDGQEEESSTTANNAAAAAAAASSLTTLASTIDPLPMDQLSWLPSTVPVVGESHESKKLAAAGASASPSTATAPASTTAAQRSRMTMAARMRVGVSPQAASTSVVSEQIAAGMRAGSAGTTTVSGNGSGSGIATLRTTPRQRSGSTALFTTSLRVGQPSPFTLAGTPRHPSPSPSSPTTASILGNAATTSPSNSPQMQAQHSRRVLMAARKPPVDHTLLDRYATRLDRECALQRWQEEVRRGEVDVLRRALRGMDGDAWRFA